MRFWMPVENRRMRPDSSNRSDKVDNFHTVVAIGVLGGRAFDHNDKVARHAVLLQPSLGIASPVLRMLGLMLLMNSI